MAASVLLNFAFGVDFAPTDPLLCLVRTGAQLLSYDRLSVERFPDVGMEDRAGFVRRKMAELRNMLEDRSLSSQDQGERIRIVVLLDFKPWEFLEPEGIEDGVSFDSAYPSLKVEFVKSAVERIFGVHNPLLPRIDYIFVFVDDTSDQSRSNRYRQAAFHGYYRSSQKDWISSDDLDLDQKRDEALDRMRAPDAATSLGDKSVDKAYKAFLDDLNSAFNKVGYYLKQIGKEKEFTQETKDLLDIKTVQDFKDQHYSDDLKSLVTRLCGLGAQAHHDCTFFVLDLNLAYVSEKSRGNVALKSLIQVLCGVSDDQFGLLFRPDNLGVQKFFVISKLDVSDIHEQALQDYAQDINAFGRGVTGMKWGDDKEVTYTEFTAPEEDAEGALSSYNDKVNNEGNRNWKEFHEARRVPFFFGTKPGDWGWYRKAMGTLDKCLMFEEKNERPLVDGFTRVNDSNLDKRTIKTNFDVLGTSIKNAETAEIVSTVDYDKYIRDRKDTLALLRDKSQVLAKEMKKLGLRSRFLWIAILAILAFTVCYAIHFYSPTSSGNHPLWISAGLLAFCLVAALGAVIAQVIVKGKVLSVHREIDTLMDKLKELSRKHLKSVNDLAKAMNEADARRKTLFEMNTKYNQWKVHNKKVENWLSFTKDVETWLDTLFSDLGLRNPGGAAQGDYEPVNLDLKDTLLDSKPSIVYQIRSRYQDMKPVITVNNNLKTEIQGVACFISNFSMEQPK